MIIPKSPSDYKGDNNSEKKQKTERQRAGTRGGSYSFKSGANFRIKKLTGPLKNHSPEMRIEQQDVIS
jgi:hypothetical protein